MTVVVVNTSDQMFYFKIVYTQGWTTGGPWAVDAKKMLYFPLPTQH